MNHMHPYIFQKITKFKINKFIVLSTFIIIMISGCMTPNTKINTDGLTQARPTHYEATGRLALKMNRDSGQVNFNWIEKNNTSKIAITGPLGQGSFIARIKPDSIEATIDGKNYTSSNPDQLFEELTKINWPVSATKYWLIGQASNPDKAIISKNKQNVTEIIENGWIIQYPQWQATNQGLLPRLIIIKQDIHKNMPNNNTEAKILVNRWKL